MFEYEIDKFRRALELRENKYQYQLEKRIYSKAKSITKITPVHENTPIEDPNRWKQKKMRIRYQEEFSCILIDLELKPDFLSQNMPYIEKIYKTNADNTNPGSVPRKTVENNLDLLYSSLFKTTPIRGKDFQSTLNRCLDAILSACDGGLKYFYDKYDLVFTSSDTDTYNKNDFLNAVIALNINTTGKTTDTIVMEFENTAHSIRKHIVNKNLF